MIVPSQKEASDRFDLRNVDSSKVFSRADSRILGAALQHLFEATRGVSLGTDEGSSSGINDLSVISATNYTTYQEEIMQAIQTCVANKNLLTVDPSSTANGLILTKRYIDNETTVSGINEAVFASFPYRFRDGLELDFVAIANNTGAVTISIPNFQGVNGALDIVKQDGSALIQGDIQVGYRYTIICDNTNNRFILKNLTPAKATIYGLTYLTTKVNLTYNSATSLLYSVVDAETKEEITSGTINLSTIGVNGLDTGTLQANTTYHIFEIKDLTNNLVKTITSTSLTSPTLPSGFTKKKHIFSFITNASSQLRPFEIDGNYVRYLTQITDFATPTATSPTLTSQISIPPNSYGDLHIQWISFSTGAGWSLYLYNTSDNAKTILQSGISIAGYIMDASTNITIKVDNNRQLNYYVSGGGGAFNLYTQGYYLYL